MALLDQMLSALPSLPYAQLKLVTQRCRALLGLVGPTMPEASPPTAVNETWGNAVAEGLKAAHAPISGFGVRAELERHGERIGKADRWLARHLPDGLTRTEQQAITILAVRALIHKMHRNGIPLSCRSLCNCLPLLPQAMDEAYPGYAASGLLFFLVRKKNRE